MGLPPLLTRLTRLVFSPMAAIAMAIINLPMEGSSARKGKLLPTSVFTTAASTKYRINIGKMEMIFTSDAVFLVLPVM